MSTTDPAPDPDVVAEWPDDWDSRDDDSAYVDEGPPTTVPRVELIPSMWAGSDGSEDIAPSAYRRNIRVAAVIVGVILGGGLLWWLMADRSDTTSTTVIITPAPTSAPPNDAHPPEDSSDAPVPTVDAPPPTGQPATGPAAQVAAGFAADYGNPGAGKDDWLARVSRWTSPQLTDGYRMTDPNRLPEAVFQHLSPPLNNDSATIVYDATYDTMTLEIRLAFVEDRWQVISALDTQPQVGDVSPPGSTPSPTPPVIPPDLAPAPAGT